MRIKTFEAPTMQEALALAKTEFGDNAVVLNTKHVKTGGLLGLGGTGRVEIMAAADDAPGDSEWGKGVSLLTSNLQPPTSKPGEGASFPISNEWRGESYSQQVVSVAERSGTATATPAMSSLAARLYAESRNVTTDSDLEIRQLKSDLRDLTALVQSIIGSPAEAGQANKPLLVRLGVEPEFVNGVLADLAHIEDPAALMTALAAKMQAFAQPPALVTRQVIALVGPTGVGKTTTLAKLAAKFSLEQGKKVALVTADTYRIGAVEQLRTYARIMGVPLEIALSPEEVAAGVERHGDKDVVLIDTVGRSQRSDEHLRELKSFVDAAAPTDTHLVISATLASEVQREVVEKFIALSPTKLVITKLDESPNRGCLVNLPLLTGLGISCATAGQNVPRDIDFAEPGRMARMVVETV